MGKGKKIAIIFGILFLIGGILLPLGGKAALWSIPGYEVNTLPSWLPSIVTDAVNKYDFTSYIALGLGGLFIVLGAVTGRGGGVKMPKEVAMPTEEPKPEMVPEMKMEPESPKEEPMMEEKEPSSGGIMKIGGEEPSMESPSMEEPSSMGGEESSSSETEAPSEEEPSELSPSETPQFMPGEEEEERPARKTAKKKRTSGSRKAARRKSRR